MMPHENLSPIAAPQSNFRAMFDDLSDEWREWIALTPMERWRRSQELFAAYVAAGGSLDPDPDPQCPFYFPEDGEQGTNANPEA